MPLLIEGAVPRQNTAPDARSFSRVALEGGWAKERGTSAWMHVEELCVIRRSSLCVALVRFCF